jgi:Gpi18-like mannosyltransferase
LFKIPGILADVGIGIILYKMTKGTKYEKIVLIAWLFNPFTFMISSIWGALDPVAAFFAVAAVYLVWKNKPVLSAVFLSLGFATKIFPAFLLIPVLIYLTKTKSIKDSFKYLATFLAVAVIVFGLFAALPGGFTFIYNLFFFKSSADISLAQSSGYGVTLAWTSILQLGSLPVFPLIFVPAFVVLCVGFWKFGKQFDSLVVCCACTLLLTYLAYPVVNPQYVFWVFPFLTYLAVKRKFHWILYVGLMAAVFLFVLALYNPVQFISPAFVPNELNFQPWSNLVKSMRLILNNSALAPIAISFAAISLASLAYLTKVPTRVIHRRRENEDITSH